MDTDSRELAKSPVYRILIRNWKIIPRVIHHSYDRTP